MGGRCVKVRIKKRMYCVGDLDTEIGLENRSISSPLFEAIDFTESFTPASTVWAGITTMSGNTFFDGVNTETLITHKVVVVYDETITAETWIVLDGTRRLDILDTQDVDEQKEFMLLVCTERGLVSRAASQA